jgi:Flp pilus assembly protein TadD
MRSPIAFSRLVTATAGMILVALLALPVAAQGFVASVRGDSAAYDAEGERLFAMLALSKTEADAAVATAEIWSHWLQAPDSASAGLMNRALGRRRAGDDAGSIAILDELVGLAPDWAEAWNQRATMRFVVGDYEGSLADIDETLEREPKHFGALSGQALILLRLGRDTEAQSTLRKAVKIHPFLHERVLIVEEPGRDI